MYELCAVVMHHGTASAGPPPTPLALPTPNANPCSDALRAGGHYTSYVRTAPAAEGEAPGWAETDDERVRVGVSKAEVLGVEGVAQSRAYMLLYCRGGDGV